mgnify:CR=1 FL=1
MLITVLVNEKSGCVTAVVEADNYLKSIMEQCVWENTTNENVKADIEELVQKIELISSEQDKLPPLKEEMVSKKRKNAN